MTRRGAATVVLAIVAAAVVVLPPGGLAPALAIAASTVLGTAWTLVGLRRHRLRRPMSGLLAAAAGANLVVAIQWASPAILGTGGLRDRMLENHGGTLTFETESGAGTTFHVRLPIGSTAEVLEAA